MSKLGAARAAVRFLARVARGVHRIVSTRVARNDPFQRTRNVVAPKGPHSRWPGGCCCERLMTMLQAGGDAWTPEHAERTARELGIALRPAHWLVVGCARELSAAGLRPELAVLARASGLSVEAIGALFPDAERTIGWIADVG